jgi:hypothetical protein
LFVVQQAKKQRPAEVVTVKLAPRAKKTVTWAADVVGSESCKHCKKCAKRKCQAGQEKVSYSQVLGVPGEPSSGLEKIGFMACINSKVRWTERRINRISPSMADLDHKMAGQGDPDCG